MINKAERSTGEIGSSLGNKKVTCPRCRESGHSHGDKDLSIHVSKGYGKCHKCGFRLYIAEAKEGYKPDTPIEKFVIPDLSNFRGIKLLNEIKLQDTAWMDGFVIITSRTWTSRQ